jgi:hypothetical protein
MLDTLPDSVVAFTHEEAHALLREAVAAGDTRCHVLFLVEAKRCLRCAMYSARVSRELVQHRPPNSPVSDWKWQWPIVFAGGHPGRLTTRTMSPSCSLPRATAMGGSLCRRTRMFIGYFGVSEVGGQSGIRNHELT